MREGNRDMAHALPRGEFRRDAMEPERWFARGHVGDFKVAETYPVAPARPDCLHAGFLGGKPRGVPLEAIRFALDVGDFRGGEDPLQESSAVTLNRRADPRHFTKIHAGADNHSPSPLLVRVRRPCLTPFVLISASAIFLTADAFPRRTSTSRQLSWSRWTCNVERMLW